MYSESPAVALRESTLRATAELKEQINGSFVVNGASHVVVRAKEETAGVSYAAYNYIRTLTDSGAEITTAVRQHNVTTKDLVCGETFFDADVKIFAEHNMHTTPVAVLVLVEATYVEPEVIVTKKVGGYGTLNEAVQNDTDTIVMQAAFVSAALVHANTVESVQVHSSDQTANEPATKEEVDNAAATSVSADADALNTSSRKHANPSNFTTMTTMATDASPVTHTVVPTTSAESLAKVFNLDIDDEDETNDYDESDYEIMQRVPPRYQYPLYSNMFSRYPDTLGAVH